MGVWGIDPRQTEHRHQAMKKHGGNREKRGGAHDEDPENNDGYDFALHRGEGNDDQTYYDGKNLRHAFELRPR